MPYEMHNEDVAKGRIRCAGNRGVALSGVEVAYRAMHIVAKFSMHSLLKSERAVSACVVVNRRLLVGLGKLRHLLLSRYGSEKTFK